MKRYLVIVFVLTTVTALMACAPGPNEAVGIPGGDGSVAGFWLGLWHGFIVLFTFVISLFKDGVQIYEVHNTGPLYDLGFVFGAMSFLGGGCGAGRKCGK